MASILAVGIATLDIINTVERYPEEDSEVRVLEQKKTRGGNATNTLVVLSQLGHDCHWAGVSVDEPDAQLINEDLQKYAISTEVCKALPSGKLPTSYITVSQQTASRSIVHHRDCPEYNFDDFQKIDLSNYDWLHFEGRNIDETRLMLHHVKKHYPDLPCSLEVEKARDGIETLFEMSSLLFFSKHYAFSRGIHDPVTLLKLVNEAHPIPASCTWGEQGACAITSDGTLIHSEADSSQAIVDTIGAGDTFNAGFISSLIAGEDVATALDFSRKLASHKCSHYGFADLLKNFGN